MGELIERPLPSAPEAERNVLGSILTGVRSHEVIFDKLRPEDFFVDQNRRIYRAALKIREAGKIPDLLAVHDLLASSGELESAGGIGYIAQLGDGIPRLAPVEQWAQTVREKARLRQAIHLASNIKERAFDQMEDAGRLIDSLIEDLSTVAREIDGDTDDGLTYRDAAVRLLEEISENQDAKIYTGIDSLDRITGGGRVGELWIVTAETGVGKTVLAQQMRRRACNDGRHSLFASGEMLAPHLQRRELATAAAIPHEKMRRRDRLTDSEFSALIEAANHQCQKCRILDGELELSRIRRAARRMKARTGLDLIVLDYDELISAPGKDELEQQKNLARAAKSMALELTCLVLLVSQLRKPLAGEDVKRPTLQRVYGTGAKVKFASIVLLADREYVRELQGDETSAQIFVLKNRDGRVGRIPCRFDVRKLHFESAPEEDHATDGKARAAGVCSENPITAGSAND
jgi:replicative DNA helicase